MSPDPKEREQDAVGVDVEPAPSAESATEHELVWATNGERSVRELVERTLNGTNALVVTGYQDFLSAMSIIIRVRPSIISEPTETIRIIFGTNTDNQSRLDGSGTRLSEEARDYFLETRGPMMLASGLTFRRPMT